MPDFFKPRQQKETPTQLEPKAGWGLGNIDTEPSEYESETAVEPTTGLVGRSSSTISPSWGRSALESTTASNENIQESTTTVKSSSDKDAHEFGNFEEGIQSRDNGQAVQSRKGGFTNDGRDYQPIAPPFDEDLAAGWQHLRRRNSVPLATQNGPSELAAQDHPFGSAVDVDWIDRSFEEHRQKREAATRSQPAAPESRQPTTTSPFASATANSKRCARCGELGHIARQCRSTVEMTCKVCQQPGHIARNCPTVGNSSSNVGQNTSPNRVIRYHAVEKTRRSSDNLSNVVQDISPSRIANPFTDERSEFSGASRSEKFASFRRTSTEGDVTRRDLRTSRYDLGDDSSIRENERLKSFDRKPSRRNSRNSYNDEDDEAGAAREDYQVRKQARRAQKEKEKQNSLREREIEWPTSIRLPEFVTVQRLSQMLGVRYEKFVRRLERLGYDDVFPGKVFNSETSGMIAMDYNIEPIFEADSPEDAERDLIARPEVEDKDFLQTRPPVVTIMGHVDHGKTTILDYLRKSSVAAGEAGGITQHIGAFSVPLASTGKTITFLDTPGHEAFLAMRQRGANVTDIVILVVAADDSVKPQTLEAIKHAKAAGVPIVVAINKIDKDGADADRCKKDLSRHGIDIEDYGGETQVVCVSGKTGQGMDDLEETVVALSEVLDHRADTEGAVEGWIIEATTKKAGRVATVLVRRGTLRPGCLLVAGKTWARVRTLQNEGGQTMHEIGPGMPVEIDGWKDQPSAGDEVLEAPNEQKATSVVEYRHEVGDRLKAASDMVTINETRKLAQERREREKQAEAEAKLKGAKVEAVSDNTAKADSDISGQISIPFIIKADVSGSAEAVSAYVLGVSNPLITPTILHSGVGAIHESDIDLASAASAHIIAFNLPANTESRGAAEAQGVKVLENNIIYRILDDVKAILEESLPPLISHKVLGEAEISASFDIGVGGRKKIWIAGCKVRNGVISRSEKVRVWRNGEKVYDGKSHRDIILLQVHGRCSNRDFYYRNDQLSQECQKGCPPNAQGNRVRHRI